MGKGIVFKNHNNELIYPCPYFPIGYIYLSVSNVNPSSYFGGTWEQIKDKFLLTAGNTYSAGATGGEAIHTLTVSEMPSHTHSQNSHYHVGHYWTGSKPICLSTLNGNTSGYTTGYSSNNVNPSNEYTGSATATNQNTGGNGAHNNMPPYLVVFAWKKVSK